MLASGRLHVNTRNLIWTLHVRFIQYFHHDSVILTLLRQFCSYQIRSASDSASAPGKYL